MEEICNKYFDLMARNFPIICASDEFYFFPRVQESLSYMTIVDDFDSDKIKMVTDKVKALLNDLDQLENVRFAISSENDLFKLDEQIDFELLRNSMLSFLREFAEIKIWQRDPAFYLKLVLIGIDSAISKPFSTKEELIERLLCRLNAIPGLLEQAINNLKNPPKLFSEVAHEIKNDCVGFFNFSVTQFIHHNCNGKEELLQANNRVMQQLDSFDNSLNNCTNNNYYVGKDRLHQILKESYGYFKTVDELEEMSKEGYQYTLSKLDKLRVKIDPHKSWNMIEKGYKIKLLSHQKLLSLYKDEVQKIKDFFENHGLIGPFECNNIKIKETPVYMRAIRASASYCAPVGNDLKEDAMFYISPSKEILMSKNKGPYLIDDIHREYIFTTAHEAYPGHHLLDTIRRQQYSVVRKQIESPLFYEGWASYSEFLLREYNYVKHPIQLLMSLKRDLWRYTRSLLDLGLQTNKFSCEEGAEKIIDLGFSPSEALKQVKRYAMMPGYQLSYAIGRQEILNLRAIYAPKLGLRDFHNSFLEGGQIPFKWIEKKMIAEGKL